MIKTPEKKKPAPSTVQQSKDVRERMKAITQRIVDELKQRDDDERSRLPQSAVVAIHR